METKKNYPWKKKRIKQKKKEKEKPKGKVKIFASGGMFCWGRDESTVVWQWWGLGPWERKSKEEKEE